MAKICHITLLNPALHSRIFYKQAISQAKAGYDVTIIGQGTPGESGLSQGVQIKPIEPFGRVSIRRLAARREILQHALGEKADLYIVHTPELWQVMKRLKRRLPSARIIYDVHEDYIENIKYGGYVTNFLREGMLKRVRKAEDWLVKYASAIQYAEECYAFSNPSPKEAIYLRNKFSPPTELSPVPGATFGDMPVLLHTGTIAETWGLREAMALWIQLNKKLPVRLWIAGHTHIPTFLDEIKKMAMDAGLQDRFQVFGGKDYLSYSSVIWLAERCTAGLGLYRLRENIKERIPTKFYEFMGLGKPLIYTQNPPWDALNAQFGLGIGIDPENFDSSISDILELLKQPAAAPIPKEAWSWETEEKEMLDLLSTLLDQKAS